MTEHIRTLAPDDPDAERCGCGQALHFSSTQLDVICATCGRKYIQWSVMQRKLTRDDANRPKGGFVCR